MADFAALALRLITKNGRPISLRNQTGTTLVDVTKPWLGEVESTTDTDTVGVFLDPAAADFLARVSAVSRLVLSPVETEKVGVLIPGNVAVAPTLETKIVDGGKVWGIAKVSSVTPGLEPFLYICELVN